jgi:hypothetical protein
MVRCVGFAWGQLPASARGALLLAAVVVVAATVPGAGPGRVADAPVLPKPSQHLRVPHLDSQLVQVAATARSHGVGAALEAARA